MSFFLFVLSCVFCGQQQQGCLATKNTKIHKNNSCNVFLSFRAFLCFLWPTTAGMPRHEKHKNTQKIITAKSFLFSWVLVFFAANILRVIATKNTKIHKNNSYNVLLSFRGFLCFLWPTTAGRHSHEEHKKAQ